MNSARNDISKNPLLKAIHEKPGITKPELAEMGLIKISSAGDRLQGLIVDGLVLPKDGGYYPYSPEYLPPQYSQPAVKVYRDPSVIGELTKAAAMRMERNLVATSSRESDRKLSLEYWEAVESGEQKQPVNAPNPEPEPAFTADKLEPAEVPPTSETVSEVARRKKATQIAAERRCQAAIARLEAKGEPFTRNKIATIAGLSSGYFSSNPEMRRLADEAIARCNPLLAAGPSVAQAMEPAPAHEESPHQEEPEVQVFPDLPQIAPVFAHTAPAMPEQANSGQGEAEKKLSEVAEAIETEREKAVKEQGFLREEIEELTNLYKAAERQQEFCDRLLKALGVEA